MSPKRTRWFVLALFITTLLAGCRCDNSVIPTYFGIGDTPTDGEVTSLTPSFNWHGSDSCEPDEYIFRIEEGGIPTLGLVNTNISPSNLPYTYVGGVGSDLEPGKSYTWYLTAVNGSNNGDPPVFGPKTEIGQFFTGPVCSSIALVAPELLDPEATEWLSKEHLFKWSYPSGCLPISYEVQFANDAGFTDIYLTTTTTEPYAQELLMAFPDCSSMFWRVRASDGTNFGPWSTSRDFHYVISENCLNVISVKLPFDKCDQTGEIAAWTQTLNNGCQVEGPIIVGEGIYAHFAVTDFKVDLGSGPCPSTGLDQEVGEYNPDSYYYEANFDVVKEGTYCVSISKNQIVRDLFQERNVDLMDGIWTNPRTDQVIAERTVELPADGVLLNSGTKLVQLQFMWDEIERTFLSIPLDYTYDCKLGPQKICPTYDFAPAGELITILARDRASDWKLTEINGMLCYINLPDAVIEENLAEYGPESASLEDLGFFHPPDPCLDPGQSDSCAVHTDRISCSGAGCIWHPDGTRVGGYCTSR